MQFSPDGQRLASVARNNVKLWNVSTGQEKAKIDFPEMITAICYAGENKLAVALENKTIVLMSVDTQQTIHAFRQV